MGLSGERLLESPPQEGLRKCTLLLQPSLWGPHLSQGGCGWLAAALTPAKLGGGESEGTKRLTPSCWHPGASPGPLPTRRGAGEPRGVWAQQTCGVHLSRAPSTHWSVSVFPAWMARPGQVGAWSGATPRGASPPHTMGKDPAAPGNSLGNVCVYIRNGHFLPERQAEMDEWPPASACWQASLWRDESPGPA